MLEFKDILKPKTAILLEYTTDNNPGITLFKILRHVKESHDEDIEILITDFLDMLSIYKYQAELSGLITPAIGKIPVIKIGGKLKAGNVIRKIPVSTYPVYKTLYEEATSTFIKSTEVDSILNIQIGLEYLLNLLDKRELVEQVHDLGEYLVTKTRDIRDVIFLNADAMKELPVEVLSLLSTVIPIIVEIKDENTLIVKKSFSRKMVGKKIMLT